MAIALAVALGIVASLSMVASGLVAEPASAAVYDASTYPLKLNAGNAVNLVGDGKTVGSIVKYKSVTTIDGVVIDAVIRVVALVNATVDKLDNGSAITAGNNPPGSPQLVDDLLLTDITNVSGKPQVTLEFSFYEGGTYTGVGTGVPVTLANAAISAYDIDSNGSAGHAQYVDFRGFQSYTTYTLSSTRGLNVQNPEPGSGLVRFIAKDTTFNAGVSGANGGSYSFARVQVNYDRISTLTVRLGVDGTAGAYYALDLSVGGIWTTDGTTPVTPTTDLNPFNTAPTTANISTFYAAQGTGYVFRTADFPYADVDNNAFASIRIPDQPASAAGILEFLNGTTWQQVYAGQVISTSDIDLGKLRLTPTSIGGNFTFQVNDGLVFSTTATLTFTAPANSQTITFPNPGTQAGGSSQVFASAATASSGLTPTLTTLTPGVCTVSGLTITTLVLPAGVTAATCVITATQDGNASYGRAQAVTQQFSVSTLLAQTITFANPGDQAFSASPILSGAVTSAPAHTVTLSSLTTDVCTVTGTSIVPVAPGLCSVRATQPGDASYSAASPVTQTFTLLKAAQAITFAQPGTRAIDGGALTVAPTTDAAGLTPTLASSTTAVCTVSGFVITFVAPGTCTLTASQAGDATYLAATGVTRSFQVIEVTTSALNTGQAGTAFSQQMVVAGAAGGGIWSSTGLPAGLTLDPSSGLLSGSPSGASSGSVTITYTEGGASHSVTLPLSIAAAPAPQTITFVQPATRAIDGGALTVAPTTDAAGLTPTLASSTTAVCTVSGFVITFVAPGTCTVTASQAGDASYLAATGVTRSFQVIEVTTSALDAGQAGVTFSQQMVVAGAGGGGAWSSAGLPAGLAIDPTSGVLSGVASGAFSGSVTITYTEGGASHSVTLPLSIAAAAPLPQTITFALPSTQAIDGGALTVAPTTDAAGLTPTLASSTTAVCTVSGFVITFVAPGTCTVTASQTGDATYLGAAIVSRSFHIMQVTTSALSAGQAGVFFSQQMVIAGAAGGGVWSATSLPAGLTLDPSTGVVSGLAAVAFSGPVTITYTEGGASSLVTLALDIAAAAVVGGMLGATGVAPLGTALIGGLLLLGGFVFVLVSFSRRRRQPRH